MKNVIVVAIIGMMFFGCGGERQKKIEKIQMEKLKQKHKCIDGVTYLVFPTTHYHFVATVKFDINSKVVLCEMKK